jgi:hypothetical protein
MEFCILFSSALLSHDVWQPFRKIQRKDGFSLVSSFYGCISPFSISK